MFLNNRQPLLPLSNPNSLYFGRSQPLSQPGIDAKNDIPRAVNFYADFSGCGHWRMIWPEAILKIQGKINITSGTVMIGDPNFYQSVGAVRVQRQATPNQLQFTKFLQNIKSKHNFRFII
jgi:hypothetical protein